MVKKVEIKEQTQKIIDTIQEGISKRVNIPNSDKVIYACLKDYECEYKNGKYCGVDMKKGVLTENDCLYCEGRHVNGIPYDLAINEMATAMCKEDYERSGNGCVGCPYAPYRSERCREAVRYILEYGKYTDLAVVATKVLLGVNK